MNEKINFEKIERYSLYLLVLICLMGGLIFGYITSQIKNFSGIENLRQFQPSIPTKLYDVNGEMIAELFQEKRDMVPFEQIPRSTINAFIAAEDGDFYSHYGIDPMAIMRAMVKNIIAMKVVQGGSTITQQLSKRLFTTGERTFMRKALEAVLTLQIEKKFSKDEILEMYFNQIYLGHGCYGISSAAKLFFNKEVKHLNVAESSVLAALPSAPGRNSPLLNARTAYEVNRGILNRMVDIGFLSKERADKIYREFWPAYIDSIKLEYPSKTVYTKSVDKAPFFTDYVRQVLIARFGKDVVYNEGLSVYTTLNLRRQEVAQKVMEAGIKKQDDISARANKYYFSAVDRSLFGAYSNLRMIFNLPGALIKNDPDTKFKKQVVDEFLDSMDIMSILVDADSTSFYIEKFREAISGISSALNVEGALIAIEPPTGYITSMVGGSEFSVDNQYNRAMQAKRQPGSAFKPFVYGAAIEAKVISPAMNLPDAPIVDIDASGESWSPANYEGGFSGMVSVRRALAKSINIISVRIYDLVGPDKVIDYASKMLKVPTTRFSPNPTLALGTTEVTPFEMATGFSIYANRGRDVIPFAVRYVVDRDGNELANIEEEVGSVIAAKEKNGSIQVISEDVAYIMTSLLQSVIDTGTPYYSIRTEEGFKKKCAGKTGTTSGWSDAWFCGFTPDIAAIVWFGYDKSFMSLGKHQAAAGVAAPVWAKYMKEVYNGMNDPVFPPQPPGVIRSGDIMLKGASTGGYSPAEYKMKTVLERYMEKEGLMPEKKEK